MNTSSSNNPQIFRLKGVLFTLFILLAVFASAIEANAGSIGSALHARLLSALPQDTIPVIIQMADRVDLQRYRGMEKRQAQRSLIADLKSRAEQVQGPVIAFLNRTGIHNARKLWINNSLALSVPPAMVETLAALPDVEELRLDVTIQAPVLTQAAPVAPPEWNIDIIGAPALWNLNPSFTGQGVVVATFDTGVDIDHPDINPKWRGGSNSWFDPYTPSTIPYDGSPEGHGTAVIGLIVGGENGGTTIGVAPDAQWISAKIFADDGSAPFSAIHTAFQWALDPDGIPGNGDEPDIVNHSWGLAPPGTCSTEFDFDINALKAAGIAVVFSAGNAGPGSNSSISPGNNTGSLAVGMTDSIDTIHPLSSRGPSPCDAPGIPYPELVAPGVAVRTADLSLGGTSPNPYVFATGTSFSAPHVSGAMALLLSAAPNSTVAELESALEQSAVDLGAVGPDNEYGYGRLDVAAAATLLNLPPPPATLFAPANLAVDLETDVTFEWFSHPDPNGHPVTDSLLLSTSPDFSQVTPIVITSIAGAKLLVAGTGSLLLMWIILAPFRSRLPRSLKHLLLLAGLFLLLSCGGGSSGSPAPTGSDPAAPLVPNASHTVTALDPATTYFWKIISDDGLGGVSESEVWQFSTR